MCGRTSHVSLTVFCNVCERCVIVVDVWLHATCKCLFIEKLLIGERTWHVVFCTRLCYHLFSFMLSATLLYLTWLEIDEFIAPEESEDLDYSNEPPPQIRRVPIKKDRTMLRNAWKRFFNPSGRKRSITVLERTATKTRFRRKFKRTTKKAKK